ncbi:hypothetical protein D9M68_797090 [compost metagenome]
MLASTPSRASWRSSIRPSISSSGIINNSISRAMMPSLKPRVRVMATLLVLGWGESGERPRWAYGGIVEFVWGLGGGRCFSVGGGASLWGRIHSLRAT